ncbi:hypothetical protein [Thalassotalea sp. G2M2-11]|uniref:hypothetical protein n=1 Tax=Thalassotalea sp. G2M2-11 TaxID=2787627 RepID=UPI0019D084EF|nr:hypothetical protein [Thalassotalea sp. G2M2-11]
MIKYIFTVCLFISFLTGCAYKATYYKPVANTEDDHIQNSQAYIYRGAIKLEVWTQENSDSTWLFLSNNSENNAISITSSSFYISGESRKSYPSELRVISKIGDAGHALNTNLESGEVLVIEFKKEIQRLESFTLHLPKILTNNDNVITDLSTITFKKASSWRAISIN